MSRINRHRKVKHQLTLDRRTTEKFLGRNTSCKTLLLNGCNLRSAAMHYLGLGLQKNFYLTKLGLSENDMIEKEGF